MKQFLVGLLVVTVSHLAKLSLPNFAVGQKSLPKQMSCFVLFFESEEPPTDAQNFFSDEQLAVTHFQDTISRDPDGRYIVALPFKESPSSFGQSRPRVAKRLEQNQRILLKKDKRCSFQQIISPHDCHKALGIHWDTAKDNLHIATPKLDDSVTPTKNQVLSDIARTFDVRGFFSLVTVTLKVLLQKLWQLKLDWDENIPTELSEIWSTWRKELPLITNHPILRIFIILQVVKYLIYKYMVLVMLYKQLLEWFIFAHYILMQQYQHLLS